MSVKPRSDEVVDALDLAYVELAVEAVVGARLAAGLDEAFLFVFPDAFLGEVDASGNLVDQVERHVLAPCNKFRPGEE